uniref:Ig-like domain-containing protein n=1 Tax=Podarcis muralis TaxID=64176 RepID=A0A670JA24_PODMU
IVSQPQIVAVYVLGWSVAISYGCGLPSCYPFGESLAVRCKYDVGFRKHVKYWCKGSPWSSCEIVVRTTGSEEERMAIRLENLTQEDAGIYWCGIERTGSDPGFRVNITVLPGESWKSLSLRCRYQQTFEDNTKSWCKIKKAYFVFMRKFNIIRWKGEHGQSLPQRE